MVDEVLKRASFKTSDIQVLSQVDTTMSKHVMESNPDKKYMLKELSRVVENERHTNTSYILLIDDSPEKNLLNS
jgi:predicted phosphatase